MTTDRTWVRYMIIVTALLWIGMLLGVSFLATPAKFLAPSLTLAVALDVGRQTFGVFSVVEVIGAFVLLVAAAMLAHHRRRIAVLVVLIGCFVAAQFFWLLPVLDARVEIILRGGVPEESDLHSLYVAVEAAKLLLLGLVVCSAYAARPERAMRVAANAR